MAEITKAKQQRSSGEPTLSQDNLEAARAQARPRTSTTEDVRPLAPTIKTASVRESAPLSPSSRPSSRIVTPPTKVKPAALVGKRTSFDPNVKETVPSKDSNLEEEVGPQNGALVDNDTVIGKTSLEARDAPVADNTLAVKDTSVGHDMLMKAEKVVSSSHATKSTTLSSPFVSPNPSSGAFEVPKPLAFSKPSSLASPLQKSDTAPKNDFRSTLKSRSDLGSAPSKPEPEFRAMFGKLKKAQTDKYVAPDELKNNIVSGKARLSVSSGPQKSERRDELRDSLVKKKDEIKTKAADNDLPEHKVIPPSKPEVPEALQIKKRLGRSNSSLNVDHPEKQRRDVTPEALSLHKTLRAKARGPSPEKPAPTVENAEFRVPAKGSASTAKPEFTVGKLQALTPARSSAPVDEPASAIEKAELSTPAATEDIAEPVLPARSAGPVDKHASVDGKVKPEVPPSSESSDKHVLPPINTDTKPTAKESLPLKKPVEAINVSEDNPAARVSLSVEKPTPVMERVALKSVARSPVSLNKQNTSPPKATSGTTPVASKFADRFNPALAGLLARGPPAQSTTPRAGSPTAAQPTISSSDEPSAGAELTHMTKNRVKGPKRRKPNKSANVVAEPVAAKRVSSYRPVSEIAPAKRASTSLQSRKSEEVPGSPKSTTPFQPPPKSAAVRAVSLRLSSGQFGAQIIPTNQQESGETVTQADEKQSSQVTSPPEAPTPVKSAPPPSLPRKPSGTIKQQPVEPYKQFTNKLPTVNTPDQSPPTSNTRLSDANEANKENQSGSVKNFAAMWGKSAQHSQKRSSPIQLPTKKDEDAAMRSAGLLSDSPRHTTSPPPRGLGISESPLPAIPRDSVDSGNSPSSTRLAGLPPRPPTKSSRVVSASLSSKGTSRVSFSSLC